MRLCILVRFGAEQVERPASEAVIALTEEMGEVRVLVQVGDDECETLKYRPDFPNRFDSIEAARRHCQSFFGWYNDEHRHTGLGLHVPADVHYGTATINREKRAGVLDAAYAAHPEGFVQKPPTTETAERLVD